MVVCGAMTTEHDYLVGFKKHFKRSTLSVRVTKKPGSPLQVVQYAVDRWGGASSDFDQVWCVVDVDEYQDLESAMRCASENNVELVVSNPCFEIWLLLHHTHHHTWVADYKALKILLKKYVDAPANKAVDFERHYRHLWRDAVKHARTLAEEGTEHKRNPSTRMWRLALTINGESGA
ncbi:RloB family protein [Streptomyces lonegramiae]|uniref:RloB family protein n=1 Tax=Streptomyces lonegramiae TaxID=3075524 RepID=A0ABU2XRS7_9ACTN|nr:RloB family protein [Streptomyces sp. DSM 41529]MDT0548235.1 RloB family protein [Streptomyces sp. DSM 41529]